MKLINNKSYVKNFFSIYFWRTISLISGFLSLIIVIPLLSSNQEIFGIYSFCISLSLFLTYADIGFLSAAQKYAAEAYAKGDRDEEMGHIGFIGALLILMIIPFCLCILYLSNNPELLLGKLDKNVSIICSNLLLVLAILFPIQFLLQRILQSILIIRIKEFISLRIDVITNIIKVFSIFYFIGEDYYNVVGYLIFTSTVTIFSQLLIATFVWKMENYNFFKLLSKFRISRKYYRKVRKLAFSSFAGTIGWVLFFEVDQIIIGSVIGPLAVSIYSVAFTILNFLRNLWGIFYSPFLARLNHFVANNDFEKIKSYLQQLINYSFPIALTATLVLYLSSQNLVYLWVGKEYNESIPILKYFILSYLFIFLNYPSSFYFITLKKYKFLLLTGVIPVITYYFFLMLFISKNDVQAFGIAKFFAFISIFITSIIGTCSIYRITSLIHMWWIESICVITFITYIYIYHINPFFSTLVMSKTMLIFLLSINGLVILFVLTILILAKSEMRTLVRTIIQNLTDKN